MIQALQFPGGLGFGGGAGAQAAELFAIIGDHATQYFDLDVYGTSGAKLHIDFGDGTSNDITLAGDSTAVPAYNNGGDHHKPYAANGTYTIRITGNLSAVKRIFNGTANANNRMGVTFPHGLAAMRNLVQLQTQYAGGDATTVGAVFPSLTVFRINSAITAHGGDYCLIDTSTFSLGSITDLRIPYAGYGAGVTGDLSAIAGAAVQYLFMLSTGATGTIDALATMTSMTYCALNYSSSIAGDLATLGELTSLATLNCTGVGALTCTFDSTITWAVGGVANFTNCGSDTANMANLLYAMAVNGHADWDGEVVTVTGVTLVGDEITADTINYYAKAQGWAGTGGAGWVANVVNAANITVVDGS